MTVNELNTLHRLCIPFAWLSGMNWTPLGLGKLDALRIGLWAFLHPVDDAGFRRIDRVFPGRYCQPLFNGVEFKHQLGPGRLQGRQILEEEEGNRLPKMIRRGAGGHQVHAFRVVGFSDPDSILLQVLGRYDFLRLEFLGKLGEVYPLENVVTESGPENINVLFGLWPSGQVPCPKIPCIYFLSGNLGIAINTEASFSGACLPVIRFE